MELLVAVLGDRNPAPEALSVIGDDFMPPALPAPRCRLGAVGGIVVRGAARAVPPPLSL